MKICINLDCTNNLLIPDAIGAKYCPICGLALSDMTRCKDCGFQFHPKSLYGKFCGGCGRQMDDEFIALCIAQDASV